MNELTDITGKIDWDFDSEGWMAHYFLENNCPYDSVEQPRAYTWWCHGWDRREKIVVERDLDAQ